MRRVSRRAHPDCVTPHGPSPGMPPQALIQALAEAATDAVEAVGGYAGGVYLRSGTEGLLRLSVLAGLPGELFRPWSRMHTNRPFPVAEVHRSGQSVHLADVEESMRRFPQLVASLPFPFGSLYAPVVAGRERFGVLVVLRPPTPGLPVGARDRERMTRAALRLGEVLAELTARGTGVWWPGEPLCVQLPSGAVPPVRFGSFDWDLAAGSVTMDDGLRAILGVPDPSPMPIEALTSRLDPEDGFALWAAARRTGAANGGGSVRRLRLKGPDGGLHLLEVSARSRFVGADGHGHLAGALVDLGTSLVGSDATDRLPRAILAIDRLGRVTYVNERTERLLGRPRGALAGRPLWEALPWFAHPFHEEQLRAALLSTEPVRFLARPEDGGWLSVSLHPGRDGVTMVLVPEEGQGAEQPPASDAGALAAAAAASMPLPSLPLSPPPPPKPSERAGDGLGTEAARAASLYRPVALAIALTEAMTARQVSAVVTEELLPAFGGRQLAIYLLSDRRLYLAWETGFPPGFLDQFDGAALDAHVPGVDVLTSGRAMFFESMQILRRTYPELPLDAETGARAFLPLIASGRPVGSCILGFDRPRDFSPEERAVLTALAGLIAQALERAQRYDTEAAVARGLQDALLPHRLPVREGLETVGRYLPGTQGMDVGGDWYDVVETARGELALVIGDVQGHGVAAAATMGQLRSAVRAFALSGLPPQEVVRGTNRLLIDLDPGQFASACYVLLDARTGDVQAVRAGHPQPMLRHPDGSAELLDIAGGVVLGVDGRAAYPVTRLRLAEGAVLALFTDGLVERPGADIDEGVERLRRTLASTGSLPLAEAADRLMHEAVRSSDRPDDIALLLAARWRGHGG
ncbi:SpoIIE family protein phosphatase [Streptomyces hydrogenans]|uniref:SpoIIE family protein phosphatase n=1 Tax=Streptomyces hydrogenans TaxID=1873719 RepID=UPI0035DADC24